MAHCSCRNIPSKNMLACRTHPGRREATGGGCCRLDSKMARKRTGRSNAVAEYGRRGRCRSVDGVKIVRRHKIKMTVHDVALHGDAASSLPGMTDQLSSLTKVQLWRNFTPCHYGVAVVKHYSEKYSRYSLERRQRSAH